MSQDNEWQVIGIPGAGKTTYLSGKISFAAEKLGGTRILVSSFTRAAAKELTGRDLPIPRENIGTLHAICYRLLGNPTIAESKIKQFNEACPSYALSGDGPNMDEAAADVHYETKADKIFAEIQVLRARMVPTNKWHPPHQDLYQMWNKFKFHHDLLDFTDLIETVYNEKYTPRGVDIGVFDEAQDFTPLQMALIRQWGEDPLKYLMIAGDEDQAIYDFVGADSKVFISREIPEDNRTVLDSSYRCPQAIQAHAQAWIERIKARIPKDQKPRADAEGELHRLPYHMNDGINLTSEIEGLLDAHKDQTVMVLASCSYMLGELIATLRHRGIPFANRYRRRQRSWNPLHVSKGVSAAQKLVSYLKPEGPQMQQDRLWSARQVALWTDLCASKGLFKRGGKSKLKSLGKMDECSDDTLLSVMYESFEDGKINEAISLAPQWLYSNLLPNNQKAMDYPLKVYDREGLPGLEKEPRLLVGTIHSVKGGEADNVILFPDISMKANHSAVENQEAREAIIRQFYVGMTRARERLFICKPGGRFAVDLN